MNWCRISSCPDALPPGRPGDRDLVQNISDPQKSIVSWGVGICWAGTLLGNRHCFHTYAPRRKKVCAHCGFFLIPGGKDGRLDLSLVSPSQPQPATGKGKGAGHIFLGWDCWRNPGLFVCTALVQFEQYNATRSFKQVLTKAYLYV